MKSHFKTIALFISMNFVALTSAYASVWFDDIEYTIDGETAKVISSHQKIETACIRETIHIDGKDYPVVGINSRAFFNCEMKSVTIPATVTFIGEKSFYGCKGLTELVIPNSVTIINDNAFEKCTSIETVSISSELSTIAEGTFYDCFALSSVTIPSSVKYIEKSAFSNCHSMQTVTIPGSVDSIGPYAFYACDALKTVTIPSSVKKIGESSFWNCASLESVTISSSVTEIQKGSFYGCKSLSSVVIPSSVTSIGERAFEQCEKLPLVIIPPYLTTIDEDAFKNCKSLYTIVSYPTTPPSIARNAFYMTPEDAVIYIPSETLELYPATEGWTVFHDFRALGSIDLSISSSELNLHIDENATLTVTVDKAYDVSIESENWTSSNPDVAIVDEGIVTAVGEGSATISYIVIDGAGCPHAVSCDVFVDGISGIKSMPADDSYGSTIEYYNLNGVRINPQSLAPGIYIKKVGKRSVKIHVR